MDFFNQQIKRKQASQLYIFLFISAVLVINLALCLCSDLVLKASIESRAQRYFLVSTVFLITLIISFLKMRLGPAANANTIMQYLGAKPVLGKKLSNKQSILKNCVEEMAIASGVPCPNIYIFENETGMNAMASGYSIHDSAIAITQGCLDHLNRDEIQAVIAHEFGHILSGDTKMNMLMLASLNSINSIYLFGKFLLSPGKRAVRVKGGLYQIFLGLVLMLIGSLGQLFSKIIKAALSRQREYLADALSVQFTRNPSALTGALKKIGGDRWGSQLFNSNIERVSHMLFSDLHLNHSFAPSILASHPSLESRIRVYEKAFDGVFPQTRKKEVTPGVESQWLQDKPSIMLGGMISPIDTLYAAHFLNDLNLDGYHWLKSSEHLKAKLCAIYSSKNKTMLDQQKEFLNHHLLEDEFKIFIKANDFFSKHSYNEKIGMQDLWLPLLKKQRHDYLFEINDVIKKIIDHDAKVSLFECVAYQIFKLNCLPRERSKSIKLKIDKAVVIVLSSLSYAGQSKNIKDQESAFLSGMKFFYHHGQYKLFEKHEFRHDILLLALESLKKLAFYERQKLLAASYKTISYDEKVSEKQASILRLLGEYLEIPIPISTYQNIITNAKKSMNKL
ncbi:MAG TPA: M48 family metalloprotease [Oligoflexia bacterium]|nr:M48 family metalloprotease [Oligoflexia bacterium]HMR24886.1 M48 family metalloprotease [Oligoflexia bacterium]